MAEDRDILAEIAAYKREFVASAKLRRNLADVRSRARDMSEARPFAAALGGDDIALIAEIKKASPSKGVIRADFDPERIAAAYAENGAAALSVLTDEAYFQGCDAYLEQARSVSGLPVLRKDFILDPYQVYEARSIGADAILLIVAMMDGDQLADLHGLATEEVGLDVLVEVHTTAELDQALALSPSLIGINNRDLKTFKTNLDTTFELLPRLGPEVKAVSESGINHREDAERLQEAGVAAMLVGEALMREDDIGAMTRRILGR
jgi:indole-3-glycerol phosphate synthase